MRRVVGHPVVVNPDSHLRRIAAEEGWEILRLDRLGRRLKVIAAVGAGTALASLGRVVRERSSARAQAPFRDVGGGARVPQPRASGRRARPAQRRPWRGTLR